MGQYHGKHNKHSRDEYPDEMLEQHLVQPTEEPVVKKKINEEAISFLRQKYNDNRPIGTTLDIRPLWDDFYRLNFWGKREKDGDLVVIDSYFIRVDNTEEGLAAVHLNKGEKRNWKFTDV